MIRKYIILALLGTLGSVLSASAFSLSMTVNGNTMTNLVPLSQGSAYITMLSVANPNVGSNITVQAVDTYTNSLTYTNVAYTNIVSYATNRMWATTNFYGVINQNTNLALIDVSNSVPVTTNNFPIRATVSAQAGNTTTLNNLNAYFANGIWFTNLSPSNAIVTITGKFGE